MHYWGDDWFKENGKDLDKAISYCIRIWRRYGRIGTFGKEKYGTFRDHIWFWNRSITGLFYPGYVRIVWPWFYYNIDRKLEPFIKFIKLDKLVYWWQRQVYNYAIQKMCKKYPNIIDELVCDLDGYQFIKPGIFGKINGKEINDKYWKTIY